MNDTRSLKNEAGRWTGVVSDIALAVAKGSVGYVSGSKALMGDALYSGADAAARLSELMSWGSRRQSHDTEGTFNGRRGGRDTLPIILLSVLTLMGGLQIAFSAIRDLMQGDLHAPSHYALGIVLTAIILKEILFQYEYRQLKKTETGHITELADNHRFSLYSSLTVLIGILLAMTGSWMNWHALLYMDPIACLLVAGLVLRRGYLLITGLAHAPEVQELPREDTAHFIETVQRVHGVIRVEELKAMNHGRYVHLQVQISVNPRITVSEAQEIADCAKKLLQHRFVHVGDVHMDVVPYDAGYPYKSNYELADNDMPTLLQ